MLLINMACDYTWPLHSARAKLHGCNHGVDAISMKTFPLLSEPSMEVWNLTWRRLFDWNSLSKCIPCIFKGFRCGDSPRHSMRRISFSEETSLQYYLYYIVRLKRGLHHFFQPFNHFTFPLMFISMSNRRSFVFVFVIDRHLFLYFARKNILFFWLIFCLF